MPFPEKFLHNKRDTIDFPKLPSATSFIRRTLYEMLANLIIKGEENL
jgi:hypothetical protein